MTQPVSRSTIKSHRMQ